MILRGASADTRSLLKRVAFLQEINAALAPVFSESVAGHVAVADYCEGELVLIADSGAWATRLRYQQEQLRRQLAQHMRLNLDHIEIRVRPPATQSPPAAQFKRRISASARHQLGESARHIEDPNLAAAITRLSHCGES